MHIIECDDSHRGPWNGFVESHASFYHRFEWRDVNRLAFGHRSCYLAAIDGGAIVGVLPIVQVKSRLFGNIGCSLPFVNYGGPASVDPAIDQLLVRHAARVADAWKVEYLEIRSRTDLGDEYPTSEHKVSMAVDLSPGEDGLWQAFGHSHRKDIKRGYKNGFTAELGGAELVEAFYRVLAEAWRDMGTPILPRRYFKLVADTFPHLVRLCLVRDDAGVVVAASFQALDHRVGEGLWLGVRAKARHDLAGYVLYWGILKDAISHGCTTFNLGRSTAHSAAETYKRKWNAELTQLYWQYVLRRRTEVPQLNIANPRFHLAQEVWRHLPVPVATSLGGIVSPGIP